MSTAAATDALLGDVPPTLRPFDGPAAWYGPELARRDWIYRLSAAERAEIEAAAEALLRQGRSLAGLTARDFPLPRLGPVLTAMRGELLHGTGIGVLRGVPVAGRDMPFVAAAYMGIGAYIGIPVSQNGKGHLLGHVVDLGYDLANPNHRGYLSNQLLSFHTDSCDVVGLLCLHAAKRGGASRIVSSVTIYNEMLARWPDLVEILRRPYHVDRRGEVPAGKKPFYPLPIFNIHEGQLSTFYTRDYIHSAERFPDCPRLTERQVEAMDTIDRLANDSRLTLDFMFEPGDIQFLHNHQILHSRTDYEDHPAPAPKRHLLRLWLSPPDGRPLPAAFAERYGGVEPGRRGGIIVPGSALKIPMQPE